jgi:LacI family transcriptional regulator
MGVSVLNNIHDVANRAGVSTMTVSRVLNNGPVKKETRDRVLSAIEELNYVPNQFAKSMVSQSGARILALVMPDIINPFYTNVARGVEDVANKNNYTLIICNHDDDPLKEAKYFKSLLSLKVDGFLIIPSGDSTKKQLKMIEGQRKPHIMIDRKPQNYIGDYVGGDSFNGAIELMQHIISLNHTSIGFINGPPSISTSRDRFEGYKQALQLNGLTYSNELVYEGESFDELSAERALEAFLALENRPTAIFASNNNMAVGFIRALRKRNMDIPKDFAISCFDKLETGDLVKPTMTTAVQPAYNFGTIATQLLLERIEGNPVEKQRTIILRPELEAGESTLGFIHRS